MFLPLLNVWLISEKTKLYLDLFTFFLFLFKLIFAHIFSFCISQFFSPHLHWFPSFSHSCCFIHCLALCFYFFFKSHQFHHLLYETSILSASFNVWQLWSSYLIHSNLSLLLFWRFSHIDMLHGWKGTVVAHVLPQCSKDCQNVTSAFIQHIKIFIMVTKCIRLL